MTDGGREDREAATKGEGKESVRSRLHGLPTPVVRYFRRFVRFLPIDGYFLSQENRIKWQSKEG